jgi:membrane-associated protease RseP (regulator of RpoE activity)
LTHTDTGWRESLAADPLGIAGRRPELTPSPAAPRSDLVRLVVIIAALVALGFAGGYGETVLIILFLFGCIGAHEFGHFIAAKTGNVKVTEFFVGFGPRLWSVRRGETEYGVKAIPLGGYCRIVGMNNLEEVDPADEARTYRRAPLWRRLLIDVAGSSAHFVIALLLLFAMFFWTGDNGHYITNIPATNPVSQILQFQGSGSPAAQAGFKVGDRIEAVDGHRLTTWNRLSKYIQTGKVGLLGIGISATVHSGFGASVTDAAGAFGQTVTNTFSALGRLVSFHGISSYVHMVTDQKAASQSTSRLITVIGLPSVLHQAAQSGFPNVLWIVALVNISIGIFILLPLFPLDGGRVVVALYEGLRSLRRPYRVDMAKLLPVMYIGLAIILFFAIGSMFIDLRNVTT